MAGFRIRETGQYLPTRGALDDYRRGKGGVPTDITDDWLNSIGMDTVFEGPQATTTDQYGYSQFAGLEQIGGKWYTKYIVGPVFTDNQDGTADEQMAAYKAMKDAEQAKAVRSTRNAMLTECDWTQLLDAPVNQAVWSAYRQELRDVPAQAGFPWTINWPVKPE